MGDGVGRCGGGGADEVGKSHENCQEISQVIFYPQSKREIKCVILLYVAKKSKLGFFFLSKNSDFFLRITSLYPAILTLEYAIAR